MLLFKDQNINVPVYSVIMDNKKGNSVSQIEGLQNQSKQNYQASPDKKFHQKNNLSQKFFNEQEDDFSLLQTNRQTFKSASKFINIQPQKNQTTTTTTTEKENLLQLHLGKENRLLQSALKDIIERLYNDELIETMRCDKNTQQFIKMRVQEIIEQTLNYELQKEIKRQGQELDSLKSEFIETESQHKHTIESLSKQLKSKDFQLKQFQKQKDMAEQRLVVTNTRITQLVESLEDERKTNEQLKKKIEEMIEEINNGKEKEREKDLEIQRLEENINAYQETLAKKKLDYGYKSMVTEKEKYRINIQKIQSKASEKSQKFKSKINDLKQTILGLESQFSAKELEYTTSLEKNEKLIQLLKQKIDAQYQEFKEIRTKQLVQYEETLQKKETIIKSQSHNSEEQKVKLKEKIEIIQNLNNEIELKRSKFESEISELKQNLRDQQKQNQNFSQSIQQKSNELRQFESDLETQKELNNQLLQEQNQLNDEKINLNVKLKIQVESYNELQNTFQLKEKELLEQKKSMLLKNDEIKQIKKSCEGQIKELQNEFENNKIINASELKTREEKFTNNLNEMQQSRSKYIELTETQSKQIDQFCKQKQNLEETIQQIQIKLDKSVLEKQELQAELLKYNEQFDNLNKTINQLTTQLEKQDQLQQSSIYSFTQKSQKLNLTKEKLIKILNYSFGQLRLLKTELITTFISSLQLVQQKLPIEFQQIQSFLNQAIFQFKQSNSDLIQQQLSEEKQKQYSLVSELKLKSEELSNQKKNINGQLLQYMTEKEYLVSELQHLKTICQTTEQQYSQKVAQNSQKFKNMEATLQQQQKESQQLQRQLQEATVSLSTLKEQLFNEKSIATQQQQEFNKSIEKLQLGFTKQSKQIKIEYEKQITNLIQSLELSEQNEQKLHCLISDHNQKVLNLKQSYESKLDYFQKLIEHLKQEQQQMCSQQQISEHKTIDELCKLHDIAQSSQFATKSQFVDTCRSSMKRDFSNGNLMKTNATEFSAQQRNYSVEKNNKFRNSTKQYYQPVVQLYNSKPKFSQIQENQ